MSSSECHVTVLTSSLTFLLCALTSVVVQAAPSSSSTGCNFPDFAQTYGQQRNWASRVKEQYTEFTLRINITGGVYASYSTDSSATTSVRTCVQALSAHKYIVTYDEGAAASLQLQGGGAAGSSSRNPRRYACVQFVLRSASVLQMRYSAAPSDKKDRSLCNDANLVLDDWLLVDRHHVLDDQTLCSLQGGFSIRIYDKSRHRGVCDAYKGETRVESECTKGEGLYFYFRQGSCVPPDLLMYDTQRTLCLANWQDGPHSFTLLRHDQLPHVWLLRYPTGHGADGFTAYLFLDLVADVAPSVAQTTRYLRLDIARDSPQLITSLCVDDYEICSHATPCATAPRSAMTCPRTCNVCNASRPIACSFESDLFGNWRTPGESDSSSSSLAGGSSTIDPVLIVNATSIVTTRQVKETYHCVQWQSQPAIIHKNVISYLVVKDNVNGCRPRYACMRFIKTTSTGLVFAQISRTLVWPLTAKPEDPIDCSAFDDGSFADDVTLYPNALRTSTYNLLVAGSPANEPLQPVPCSWPADVPLNVSMRQGDGRSYCPATIRQRSSELVLVPSASCGSSAGRRRFTCLESGRLLPGTDSVIVTRPAGDPSTGLAAGTLSSLTCWIFPKRPTHDSSRRQQQQVEPMFYLVDAADCNEAVRQRARKDFRPIATFASLDAITLQQAVKTPPAAAFPVAPSHSSDSSTLPSMESKWKTGASSGSSSSGSGSGGRFHNGDDASDHGRSSLLGQRGSSTNRTSNGNGTGDDVSVTPEGSFYSLVIASILLCVMELFAFLPCF